MTEQKDVSIKTGTTTLGIVCKDGVVLAADKRATAGNFIANKKTEKVFPVAENVAITIAGLVSDAQMLSKVFRAELKLRSLRSGGDLVDIKSSANLLAGMAYENVRKMSMVQSIVGFLLAGYDKSGYYLYEIGVDGSIFQQDNFVADGSGSVFAYGVLESSYKDDISIEDGIKLARTALKTAMSRDSASGDGFDIYKITTNGLEKVETVSLTYKE